MEQHAPTLVIGAGPAGLAVAACLKMRGLRCVILERGTEIAASWRRHYERLHLHTAARHSFLPGLGFPSGTPRYPSRDQMIDYLEGYARRFGITPRLGARAVSLRRSDGEWFTDTAAGGYRSRQVVVATGLNAIPWTPAWPGQERFRGPILHSIEYRNGKPFRGRKVLVVGFGNSAGEIAIDLHEHGARAVMAVRGPVNIVPRDIFGVPISSVSLWLSRVPTRLADAVAPRVARLATGDIGRFGLRRAALSPMAQIRIESRIPLIDIGTLELIRQGHIKIRPAIRSMGEREVTFEDGSREEFDAIITATGFRPGVARFLDPTADRPPATVDRPPATTGRERADPSGQADGRWPRSRLESSNGLYFCGFTVSPIGMLREIGDEARRIAAHIARMH
ncbi:MAG: flavin-containing monooxygenase [Steroidobacteraceae bacterium]